MRRIVLVLASLLSLPAFADTSDEPEAMSDVGRLVLVPPKATLSAEGGGFAAFGTQGGSDRRLRELLGLPSRSWFTLRALVPIESKWLTGQLFVEVTTNGTGSAALSGRLRDGSKLRLSVRRDLYPYAERSRIGQILANPLQSLQTARENVHIDWEKAVGPGHGVLDSGFDFDRWSGTRPSVEGGFVGPGPLGATGYPGYRSRADWSVAARAGYTLVPHGLVRIRVQIGYRRDQLGDRLHVDDRVDGTASGSLDIREHISRDTIEAAAFVESARPGPVLFGGMYRVTYTTSTPRTDRTMVTTAGSNGTIRSESADVSSLRQRAAFGVAWYPTKKWRASARIDGYRNSTTASLLDHRELATSTLDQAASRYTPVGAKLELDARYVALRWLAFEGEARASYDRGRDAWSQTVLLSDRATQIGLRQVTLDRGRLVSNVELRAVATVHDLHVTVGGRAFTYRNVEDDPQVIDAFRIGDFDRDRGTFFAALRTRVTRRLRLDASGSYFFERTHVSGAEPDHKGFDVRLRVSGVVKRFSFFVLGALTDDRYELSQRSPTAGYAPIDFHGRAWLGTGGLTVTFVKKGSVTAMYSIAQNTAYLATQLQNAALELSWALTSRLRLTGTARYLRFQDGFSSYQNGQALLAFASATGTF
ncbi:MAG: hypothetical protein ABI321_03715 [Polyangia bacterium]